MDVARSLLVTWQSFLYKAVILCEYVAKRFQFFLTLLI